MDGLKTFLSEQHLVAMVVAMMTRVREAGRIDWTMPATWIFGLVFGLLLNTGIVIWKAATIVSALEEVVTQQKQTRGLVERMRDQAYHDEIEIARQAESDKAQTDRLNFQSRRLDTLEAEIRAKRR